MERARSGRGKHYDPPKNKAAKELIQLVTPWSKPPLEGPLRVEIKCIFRQAKPTADVDNLAKTVFDAYNKYVWRDDRQVQQLEIHKIGGDTVFGDRTYIYVYDLEASS